MTFGPCGGVRDGGLCEVDDRRCPFADPSEVIEWSGPRLAPRPLDLPTVVVDVRPTPDDAAGLGLTAHRLGEVGAGALLGEHLDDPDPGHLHITARRVAELGLAVVATITPRDRTVSECAAEVDRLVDAGVVAVHAVTGDHPAARFGPDTTAEFCLDSVGLTALARERGATVSVAESPASPPTGARPRRLLTKQHAGADMAILNHAGSADDLVSFARTARAAGVTVPLVAPVPVITDHRSAHALSQFPGVTLPAGLTDTILHATEPRAAGVAAAVAMGRALLGSGWFDHLNLSGAASGHGTADRTAIMAEIADAVVG